MIKTGGENVPSVKVEQVVLSHPAVSEIAVVGLPNDRWFEAITAFVLGDAEAQALADVCKEEPNCGSDCVGLHG